MDVFDKSAATAKNIKNVLDSGAVAVPLAPSPPLTRPPPLTVKSNVSPPPLTLNGNGSDVAADYSGADSGLRASFALYNFVIALVVVVVAAPRLFSCDY